mmetsp:Transcript_29593/g.69562  ORF Transcript_29593/g.69562 Transcript_29593/m.69562 type:complete len:84 (-) Transcript_29593:376-627(-)
MAAGKPIVDPTVGVSTKIVHKPRNAADGAIKQQLSFVLVDSFQVACASALLRSREQVQADRVQSVPMPSPQKHLTPPNTSNPT